MDSIKNATVLSRELPVTVEDLMARKTSMTKPTLNDHVNDIHLALWEDPRYQKLLDAVTDEDAVEGSLSIDNAEAARMIRTYAEKKGNLYVSEKKLATIVKSLNVVLRRYHISRKERASMVEGEVVPNGE